MLDSLYFPEPKHILFTAEHYTELLVQKLP